MNAAPVTLGLVVRQPWATLIALGVKTIETRPYPPNGPMRPESVRGLPGCSLERGERIAIVAGATVPKRGECCGDWSVETWRDGECSPCAVHLGLPSLTDGHRNPIDLPLGAVVCTVTLLDALPIRVVLPKADRAPGDRIYSLTHGDRITVHPLSGTPTAYRWREGNGHDIADQLPLGDFTPGRWGWRLGDPQPPTKWCDSCGAVGMVMGFGGPQDCLDCRRGRVPCTSIPCKGAQGVFTLPADVAEALS